MRDTRDDDAVGADPRREEYSDSSDATRRCLQGVIDEIRSLRKCVTLGDLDWKELRDEGRP